MRAFVALDLDDALRDAAVRIRDRLERSPASPKKPRFSSAEKLHVTLKFLGDIDESQAQSIAHAIEPLAQKAPVLAWKELDAFPSKTKARVIILAMEDGGVLGLLATAIEDHAEALGIDREERAYRPHVTLARLNEPANVSDWLGPIESASGIATAITLYESKGGKYVPLTSIGFR